MSEHTPGPWEVIEHEDGSIQTSICGAISSRYCRDNKVMGIEAMANAHLIAAAPEMLAGLKKAIDELENYETSSAFNGDFDEEYNNEDVIDLRDELKTIIAKAKGETNA